MNIIRDNAYFPTKNIQAALGYRIQQELDIRPDFVIYERQIISSISGVRDSIIEELYKTLGSQSHDDTRDR